MTDTEDKPEKNPVFRTFEEARKAGATGLIDIDPTLPEKTYTVELTKEELNVIESLVDGVLKGMENIPDSDFDFTYDFLKRISNKVFDAQP